MPALISGRTLLEYIIRPYMNDRVRILILEDSPADLELIESELSGSGMNFNSRRVETEEKFREALLEFAPDIILSDYDLPQFNGVRALSLARELSPGVPFILVSGAVGEETAIEVLTSGATDYVMKDRLARLVPAVRRALKESGEREKRKRAEAERDALLQQLEAMVRERTAELEREIDVRKSAQESLRAALRKLDAHMSNSLLAMIEFDPEFRVTRWSEEAERIFGWPADEIIGKAIPEIRWVHEDDLKSVQRISADMISNRRPRNMHSNRNYRRDGSVVHCEWYNSAIYDDEGRLASILSLVLDVTGRRRVEKELFESRQSVRRQLAEIESYYDNAPVGLCVVDTRMRYVRVNESLARLHGVPVAAHIGRTPREIIPHTADMFEYSFNLVMNSGEPDRDREFVTNTDGMERAWVANYYPIKENDRIDYVSIVIQEITERKRAQEAMQRAKEELEDKVRERTIELSRTAEELRKSEEAYRLLIEVNPVGVFRTIETPGALKNRRLHCNDAHLRILGYSSLQEWLAENTHMVFNSEADLNKYRELLYKKGKVINFKVRMKRKDGAAIWVLLNSTARRCDEGVLIEGTMTDISQQIYIEERLRAARKNLRAMASEIVLADERSRQHFATELHDTVVQTLGAAKLRSQLIQSRIPPKARPVFAEMQDMLSHSIIQARQIMAEMSPPVLNELGLKHALEWLTEQIGTQHGINMKFESSNEGMPLGHEVEVLLFQAARELMMNVVKHADAKNAALKFSNDAKKLCVEITDDGRGFDMKKNFQPGLKGGYGLYSIRERLQHIGGQLAIRSKPGRGTTVLILVPREIEK